LGVEDLSRRLICWRAVVKRPSKASEQRTVRSRAIPGNNHRGFCPDNLQLKQFIGKGGFPATAIPNLRLRKDNAASNANGTEAIDRVYLSGDNTVLSRNLKTAFGPSRYNLTLNANRNTQTLINLSSDQCRPIRIGKFRLLQDGLPTPERLDASIDDIFAKLDRCI
jgi:hypothetical protein